MKTEIYTVSTYFTPMLINGDDSGIEFSDKVSAYSFLAKNLLGDALTDMPATLNYWGYCDITGEKGTVIDVEFPVLFNS